MGTTAGNCELTPVPKLCEYFIHESELNTKTGADETGDMELCKEMTLVTKGPSLAPARDTEMGADRASLCQTSTIHPTTKPVWRRQNPHWVKKLQRWILYVGKENGMWVNAFFSFGNREEKVTCSWKMQFFNGRILVFIGRSNRRFYNWLQPKYFTDRNSSTRINF